MGRRLWPLLFIVVACGLINGCRAGSSSPIALAPPTNHPDSWIQPAGFQEDESPGESAVRNADESAAPVGIQDPAPEDDPTELAPPLEFESPEPSPESVQDPAAATTDGPLGIREVLNSVADHYPEIDIALSRIDAAQGKVLATQGAFDTRFEAHSISQPLGFYQTYRNGAGLARPLFGGGEVYGGYRIGDGDFEPWYGERETNEGGEFKTGFSVPLLKDRGIDKRRSDLFVARAQRDQVEANAETRLLFFERLATQAYWNWVATGQAVQVQQRVLELARTRVGQIQRRVDVGDLEEVAIIDNEGFNASRTNDLIKARRELEKSAIKLSLFFRDSQGKPVLATPEQLPPEFPLSDAIAAMQVTDDITTALSTRPELNELVAARREFNVDLQYAQNLTLPKLDLKGFAGQDIGGAASAKGDKTPFELQVGAFVEVPIQRREGLGKIQAASGKLMQIEAKLRFVSDKIRAEVQDAASAVNASFEQIEQLSENVRLLRRSLELGQQLFTSGDIDLFELNIRESAVAFAELKLLEAQFKYQFSRTVYQTAVLGATGFN